MNVLEIRLVRLGNVYVGADVSSRWNLVTLYGTDTIDADPNQASLKRRRREAGDCFRLTVVRCGVVTWMASLAERTALGVVQAARYGRLAA